MASPYDLAMRDPAGPGIRKARALPLVRVRSVELWQCLDDRWHELFEVADIMSEGAVRQEPGGRTYYGSTSVLLPAHCLGVCRRDELLRLARLVTGDPHLRVRAVRIAWREAKVRAGGSLDQVLVELGVRIDQRGLWIEIDVAASLLDDPPIPPHTRAHPPMQTQKRRRINK